MADAGSGRERHEIAGLQGVQHAVDPDIGATFQHIGEFLLGAFGVGIGGPPAGEQALVVDADPGQAQERPTGAPIDTQLGAAG